MSKNYIIIVLIVVVMYIFTSFQVENFNNQEISNQVWYTPKDCKYNTIKIFNDFFDAHHIPKSKSDQNWNIYMPCSYTYLERELKTLPKNLENKYIFGIHGCDEITRKNSLWQHLRKKYGLNGALKLSPNTYLPYESDDLQRLQSEHRPGKVYILKKNIQRQNGLFITKYYSQILNNLDQYIAIQEMLQDPYLIDNRKTNCRVYLLITCSNGQVKSYIYNDGFMYYTTKPFKPYSTERDRVITTGYVDREVYQRNPLTLEDFRRYLKQHGYQGDINKSLCSLTRKVVAALKPVICGGASRSTSQSPPIYFQLFGMDVAFDDHMRPKIIEINKGPDLSSKDKRDGQVKNRLVEDTFALIGIIPNKRPNGFIPT